MNTKRQTVWLVSMLSLMVILSAYYLFTEDVGKPKDLITSENTNSQGQNNAADTAGKDGNTNGIDVSSVNQVPAPADSGSSQSANSSKSSDDISAEDQAVLDKVGASGPVSSVFSQYQEKRDEQIKEDYNKVYSVISDTKQNEEEASKAIEQLDQLDDKSSKINGLEEELQKQYNNAAVYPEQNNKYKIVVQSENLEKSQADDILVMVIKELGVTADQVTIQYVQ